MTLQLSDEVLARRVFNKQVNDHLQRHTILNALGPYVDKDKISIDVGAATGHITYYLAPRSLEVHAFEAVEAVYKQLKLAPFPNLHPVNTAISDFDGEAEFFVDDKRLSNSGFQDLVMGPKIKVMARKLDSMFWETEIGFIKIDVEGTEFDVIKGAQEIIKRDRPNMMVEIYKPYSKYPIETIFNHLMLKHKYKCFYYQHPNLVECKMPARGVEAVLESHHIHDGDFLFVG